MKNIHILPTDNEQHSIIQKHTGLLLKQTKEKHFSGNKMNLYITSDEEIKEGDWGLSKLNEVILFGRSYNEKFYRKIILTTDQDLIKDGVQSIDDEFLEWFVKNPSCEEVKTEKLYNDYGETNIFDLVCTSHSFIYKIIIPKEEPKTFKELFANTGIKPTTDESGTIHYNFKSTMKEEPKQETLKKAAENYKKTTANKMAIEQIAFIAGAKWQAERMYSEEEVLKLVSDWKYYQSYDDTKVKVKFKEWFEQFKKK